MATISSGIAIKISSDFGEVINSLGFGLSPITYQLAIRRSDSSPAFKASGISP